MRVLAVDLGTKRIGLAVGETTAKVASPRPAIEATGTLLKDAETIGRFARGEEAQVVVIGLAELPDMPETKMSKASKLLAEKLKDLGHTVVMVDESFTSANAHAMMNEAGLSGAQRSRLVDSAAACLILDRYFHGQSE